MALHNMLTQDQLKSAFDAFTDSAILVIGDVMIDAYYWGSANRISPEAPVPIVDIKKAESRLGGAANVALNLMSLGATPIICSVIGDDSKGSDFEGLLKKRGFSNQGIVRSTDRCTTVKTRIIAGDQHLLRVDEEDTHSLNKKEEAQLLKRVGTLLQSENIKAIIFEDYDKGAITPHLISEVVKIAREMGIPTTVDPKKKQFLDFKKVTLFKPNLKEIKEGMKMDVDPTSDASILAAVNELEKNLENEISLITLSEHGVWIKKGASFHRLKAHKRKILDVSGAGDTVIATATLCLVAGMQPEAIAAISNLAGGLVCEEVGVVSINKQKLLNEAQQLFTNDGV